MLKRPIHCTQANARNPLEDEITQSKINELEFKRIPNEERAKFRFGPLR